MHHVCKDLGRVEDVAVSRSGAGVLSNVEFNDEHTGSQTRLCLSIMNKMQRRGLEVKMASVICACLNVRQSLNQQLKT